MLLGPNLSYGNAQAQRNPRRLGHQGESGQRDLHCPGSETVPPRGPELLPIRLCAGARHWPTKSRRSRRADATERARAEFSALPQRFTELRAYQAPG